MHCALRASSRISRMTGVRRASRMQAIVVRTIKSRSLKRIVQFKRMTIRSNVLIAQRRRMGAAARSILTGCDTTNSITEADQSSPASGDPAIIPGSPPHPRSNGRALRPSIDVRPGHSQNDRKPEKRKTHDPRSIVVRRYAAPIHDTGVSIRRRCPGTMPGHHGLSRPSISRRSQERA